MQARAKLKYLRIAPRKVRLVADIIRGKSVEKARKILDFTFKKAGEPMKKLLNSAVANCKNNLGFDEKNLVVSGIFVDEGPKLKRWMPRARGKAAQIQKKTSHITIILEGEKMKAGDGEDKEDKKKTVRKDSKEADFKEKPKTQIKEKNKRIKSRKLTKNLGKVFRRKSF